MIFVNLVIVYRIIMFHMECFVNLICAAVNRFFFVEPGICHSEIMDLVFEIIRGENLGKASCFVPLLHNYLLFYLDFFFLGFVGRVGVLFSKPH